MGLLELLILGLALGTDAFSVSVAVGTKRLKWPVVAKLTLLVGSLHILMPLLGIKLGQLLHHLFGHYYFKSTIDKISEGIGAGVLMILGMVMIHDNLVNNEQPNDGFDLYGVSLFIVAVSVSIDALSVGFSLSMLQAKLVGSCLVLGLIAGAMVLAGLLVGQKMTKLVDKAELLGGLALILLGLKFFLGL